MASASPPSRLYYGWIVVIACNFVAMITWGVAIFNQGVFAAHYIAIYDWPLWFMSLGPVIFHIWAGIAGIAVGQLVDRYGPRYVLVSGAFLLSAALAVFGGVSEPWHYFAAFFILSTGFACIHTITIGKIVARWFVRHRTRAMASSTIGAGIGGALLVPVNAAVIEEYGALNAAAVLAGITLATIIPTALFVIRDGPETMGLEPDGTEPAKPSTIRDDRASSDTRHWTMSAAMGTSAFWGLSICFALGMVAQSAYLFHQVPFLQSQLGLVGASWVVTVTTIAGIAGRAAFIGIGDRLNPNQWMVAVFAVQAIGFSTLAVSAESMALVVGSALFGLTMGVAVTLQPLVTAYIFGRTTFGRIYGPIYFSIRMGAAAGPGLVGFGVTIAGGYPMVWTGLAMILVSAGLLVPIAVRRPT
jgi:MFS family permease